MHIWIQLWILHIRTRYIRISLHSRHCKQSLPNSDCLSFCIAHKYSQWINQDVEYISDRNRTVSQIVRCSLHQVSFYNIGAMFACDIRFSFIWFNFLVILRLNFVLILRMQNIYNVNSELKHVLDKISW